MAIQNFKNSSIKTGAPRKTFWDQIADAVPRSYVWIAGFTGTNNAIFTSIPQTYKHLIVRYRVRDTGGSASYTYMRFNSIASTNNTWHRIGGVHAPASSRMVATHNYAGPDMQPHSNIAISTTTANIFTVGEITVFDYANANKNPAMLSYGGHSSTGAADGQLSSATGMRKTLGAITTLSLELAVTAPAANSRVDLYGIN